MEINPGHPPPFEQVLGDALQFDLKGLKKGTRLGWFKNFYSHFSKRVTVKLKRKFSLPSKWKFANHLFSDAEFLTYLSSSKVAYTCENELKNGILKWYESGLIVDLLSRIKENDPDAERILYTHLRHACLPLINNNLRSYRRLKYQAKDIFQDSFMVFYDKLMSGNFEASTDAQVTSYLNRIIQNRIFNLTNKSYVRNENVDLEDTDSYPSDFTFDWEEEAATKELFKLLNKLRKACKDILLGFYYAGKTLIEIAQERGNTHRSTITQKSKCLKELRALYEVHLNNKS